MPLPEPPENEPEHPIEIEISSYNPITDIVRYQIGIAVSLFPPTSTSMCECGINFGTGTLPASFKVLGATVGVSFSDETETELPEFEGFEQDDLVEFELEHLDGALPNSNQFGFSVEVEPFEEPDMEPGDQTMLWFQVVAKVSDLASVNGQSIQFAAGSNSPGHELMAFSGYQKTLVLPSPIPEPASMGILSLGLASLLGKRRRG
jgi:hypothetical protein